MHTRGTCTGMRPHAPGQQAGDHPVPAHTQGRGQLARGNSPRSFSRTQPQNLPQNSAISLRRANAAGPARSTEVSWLSGTNRYAPVPVRQSLSRSSEPFPLAVAPVSRAAALTAVTANGCVTHMSATIGRQESSASKSPRSGSHRERGGSCCAGAWPSAARGWAGAEGTGGPEGPAGMDGLVVVLEPR